jgi:hypothetical protein
MSGYKSSEEVPIRFHGYCSYPSCRDRRIGKTEPFVSWMGVHFPIDEAYHYLSPQAKLMAVANPSDYVEEFGCYSLNIELHPECAAEWAIHLIQDALKADGAIGHKLRKPKNAIRE